jgi:hypothetical protein
MALQNLRDKKLKGQLTGKEKLIGLSAKAAAQTEKVMHGGFVALYNYISSCLVCASYKGSWYSKLMSC